ncbi:putative ankyrin repeat-containing domain-containing protein [Plasmopara halstedii]
MDSAAAYGDLRLLQWFHEIRDGGCTTAAMDRAAANGFLSIVQWLHEHRTEGCTQMAMNEAAKNGHLDIVTWLHCNRNEGCTTMAIDRAAANSHLEIVKWLRCHCKLRCTPLALELLFSNSRRLNTAVFLYSEFPECRSFRLRHEFDVAWLEILQWLLDRTPGALDGCTLKAKSWNWHVCDWLKDNGWRLVSNDDVFSFWKRS